MLSDESSAPASRSRRFGASGRAAIVRPARGNDRAVAQLCCSPRHGVWVGPRPCGAEASSKPLCAGLIKGYAIAMSHTTLCKACVSDAGTVWRRGGLHWLLLDRSHRSRRTIADRGVRERGARALAPWYCSRRAAALHRVPAERTGLAARPGGLFGRSRVSCGHAPIPLGFMPYRRRSATASFR